MGSYTELKFKNYTLLWSKNYLFSQDGMGLFRPEDRKISVYKYADNEIEKYPAYVRKLANIVESLDLMGYTLSRAEEEIKACIHPDISIDEFLKILSFLDLDEENLDFNELFKTTKDTIRFENIGLGGYILHSPEAMSLLNKYRYDEDYLENRPLLDPLLELRCLAEIEKHADGELVWEYYDLVQGGWIKE